MKTEYNADAAFLYPNMGEQERRFFMPLCYALGAKRALLYAALRAHFDILRQGTVGTTAPQGTGYGAVTDKAAE